MRPNLVPELMVSDLQKSLGFYVGVLQFNIFNQRPDEGFAEIEKDGSHIMLDQTTGFDAVPAKDFATSRSWRTADMVYPFGRGMNLEMNVKDVDSLYAALNQASYPISMPIEERWYKVNAVKVGVRQFLVQDPDGFLLRFSMRIGDLPV